MFYFLQVLERYTPTTVGLVTKTDQRRYLLEHLEAANLIPSTCEVLQMPANLMDLEKSIRKCIAVRKSRVASSRVSVLQRKAVHTM